jgi:hypothetical protein
MHADGQVNQCTAHARLQWSVEQIELLMSQCKLHSAEDSDMQAEY